MKYLATLLILCGVAQAQFCDVRIHASRPIAPNNNVWLEYFLMDNLYYSSDSWFIFPFSWGSTQFNYSVATSNDLTLYNGAIWTNFNGVKCLNFNGSTAYASAYYNGGNTSSFTIGVWCYNTKTLANQIDFSAMFAGPDGNSSFYVLAGDNNYVRCGFRNAANQESKVDSASFSDGALNQWLFIGFCFDDPNNTLTVFTNGAQSAQTTGVTSTPKNDGRSQVFMGKLAKVDFFWAGLIGEAFLSKGVSDTNSIVCFYRDTKGRYIP